MRRSKTAAEIAWAWPCGRHAWYLARCLVTHGTIVMIASPRCMYAALGSRRRLDDGGGGEVQLGGIDGHDCVMHFVTPATKCEVGL